MRAAATADWLPEMKYDKMAYGLNLFGGFEQSADFKKNTLYHVLRSYFGLAQGDFVGMFKKVFEELGSELLSSEWEVWTLKSLLKFSDTVVDSVR